MSMIVLAVGLEVALHFSKRDGGFSLPAGTSADPRQANGTGILGRFVSAQFLSSFFPTLGIIPIAFSWTALDWMLKWYQPYVTLAKGNAVAQETLLLDYVRHFYFVLSKLMANKLPDCIKVCHN